MKSLNILLVEDCGLIQEIQSHLFQTLGHQVTSASDGFEALQKLKLQKFDVILMDLVMPGMDGMACSKQIRANGIQTPIIALSGNNSADTQQACFDAGMDGFLKKPTDKNTFQHVMQQLF